MHYTYGYLVEFCKCTRYKWPSDKHRRKTSTLACVREMRDGAKNIHSSSGCAVIRRTLPTGINDLFPLDHSAREMTRTETKPTTKLTVHRRVMRPISCHVTTYCTVHVLRSIVVAMPPCMGESTTSLAVTRHRLNWFTRHWQTPSSPAPRHMQWSSITQNQTRRQNLYTKRCSFCALLCMTTSCSNPRAFSRVQTSPVVYRVTVCNAMYITTSPDDSLGWFCGNKMM